MSTILETLEDFQHLIRNFSDRSLRWLLRDNAYVQALVKLVAPQLLPFIDFSRGMPQNRSFISKALEERESDVLLRVPFQHTAEDEVSFREALIEAVPHLEAFESPQGEQALLYFILLILHRRSAEEQEDLIAAVIQHSRNKSEVETMAQTAAEYLIEEGIAQGARETTVENTLAILTARFPNADVNVLKPAMEAISDLNRLKQLNLNASLAESFRAFQDELEL